MRMSTFPVRYQVTHWFLVDWVSRVTCHVHFTDVMIFFFTVSQNNKNYITVVWNDFEVSNITIDFERANKTVHLCMNPGQVTMIITPPTLNVHARSAARKCCQVYGSTPNVGRVSSFYITWIGFQAVMVSSGAVNHPRAVHQVTLKLQHQTAGDGLITRAWAQWWCDTGLSGAYLVSVNQSWNPCLPWD